MTDKIKDNDGIYYEIKGIKKFAKHIFQFLLDRESNISILSFFELNIISKYFPEYENEIKNLCTKN